MLRIVSNFINACVCSIFSRPNSSIRHVDDNKLQGIVVSSQHVQHLQSEKCAYCDGTGLVGKYEMINEITFSKSPSHFGLRHSSHGQSLNCPVCKGNGILKMARSHLL